MILKDEARAIALAEILRIWGNHKKDEPVILDEFTIEKDFGWVFFWDTLRHQETRLFEFAQAGNTPIIVNKFDGSFHKTGTALPVEDYIREYEERLAKAKNKEESESEAEA